jgi:hypothetical protein
MSTDRLRRPSPTVVWGGLCLATVITTWVLGKGALDASVATLMTFGIVAWKVRLVFLHFMELRDVTLPQRLVFEAWTVAAPLAIGIALVASS